MYSTTDVMKEIGIGSRTTLYKRMNELNIFPTHDSVGRLQFTQKDLDKLKNYVSFNRAKNLKLNDVTHNVKCKQGVNVNDLDMTQYTRIGNDYIISKDYLNLGVNVTQTFYKHIRDYKGNITPLRNLCNKYNILLEKL